MTSGNTGLNEDVVSPTEIAEKEMSHEKNPGWLGYIGDYATQVCGDYNKPL